MNVVCTFFANHAAQTKDEQILSVDDLASRIHNASAACKDELPWVKLARFGNQRSRHNSLRNNDNVIAITGLEADYDGGKVSLDQAKEILADAGIETIVYPSPSYTPQQPKWRLCPLSREYPPDQRARLLARLNGLFGGIFARESWVVSQSYYFGRVANPDHHAAVLEGIPIDLAEQLDAGAIGPPKERNVGQQAHPKSSAQDITEDRVRGLVSSLLDNIRAAADGEKHFMLRDNCLTLGGYVHLTGWSKEEAAEQAVAALPSADDWDQARETALWAIQRGIERPLELENRPQPPRGNGHDSAAPNGEEPPRLRGSKQQQAQAPREETSHPPFGVENDSAREQPDTDDLDVESPLPDELQPSRRTILKVIEGEYARVAARIEGIAITANLPIYSHGEALVRPVTEQRRRYDRQIVTVAVLRTYNTASLRRARPGHRVRKIRRPTQDIRCLRAASGYHQDGSCRRAQADFPADSRHHRHADPPPRPHHYRHTRL
jgi:hypothetical protein